MNFGWRVLIPISLGWIMVLMLARKARTDGIVDTQTLVIAAAVVGAGVIGTLFLPDKKKTVTEEFDEADAFAGGYPVPPLPRKGI